MVIVTMAISMLWYLLANLFRKHDQNRAFDLRRNWLINCGLPILNIQIKLDGRAYDKPAIYVANHRSFADPMVICRHLDCYVIAKAEVSKYPLISKGALLTGVLFVDRENKDNRKAVRDKMVETINNGFNVLVFPEGTVGLKQTTLDFRMGTFVEAAEQNIPIIPIAIDYQDESDLWTKKNFISQFLGSYSKLQTDVKLKFGEPLFDSNPEALKSKAQAWINESILTMQNDWTKIDYNKFEKHDPLYRYKDITK
jgi:1-acyl-sn-glycerol-3-phosphate acyltransferase